MASVGLTLPESLTSLAPQLVAHMIGGEPSTTGPSGKVKRQRKPLNQPERKRPCEGCEGHDELLTKGGDQLKATQQAQCDVKWQVLRTSTLERYHPQGGWATSEGVADNIARLIDYIKAGKVLDHEYQRRTYRVKSLLLGVLHKYRETNQTALYQVVLAFHNTLPAAGVLKIQDGNGLWGAARYHLKRLLHDDPNMFNNVKRELMAHLAKTQGDREAMEQFVKLMVEVTNG